MTLEIEALKQAAARPGTDQRTRVVLTSQLMAAEPCQEGFKYFAGRSDAAPADALWLALAEAFESRFEPQGSLNSRRACMSPRDLLGGCCGDL